jgi:hypothetical protein
VRLVADPLDHDQGGGIEGRHTITWRPPEGTASDSSIVVSRALTVVSWQSASFLQSDVRKPPGKPAF